MITYYQGGDIFDSEMQTLVNPVNTVGVPGKGLAKQFARKYPGFVQPYKDACYNGDLQIGRLLLYEAQNGKNVLCFPTKKSWRTNSKKVWIEQGLQTFVLRYKELGIRSAAFPALGCGLGNLNFLKHVSPLFIKYLYNLEIPIEVYY